MDNTHLTLGSLFSGSGGFELGGLLAGVTPLWASEVEPFAIRVTTRQLPWMRHLGDINKIHGDEIEPVDIITFGSPCTDMSVAGKRAGLDGSQSCLFYQAIRIVKEMRCATNGRYPRYIVWENVPGAFSSNKGEDFKAVLEAVCSVKSGEADIPRYAKWPNAGEILADDFSVAWRVLDAQYWGVPQRRKRIYLVSDLAGGGAGKILFESEGVPWHTPARFRKGQGTAGAPEEGSGAAGIGFDRYNGDLTYNIAQSLTASAGSSGDNQPMVFQEATVLNDQGGSRMDVMEGISGTLRAEAHHPPVVMEQAAGFCTEHSADSRGIGYAEGKSPTLRAGTVPAAVYENHSQATRYTAPTVSATYGMSGNNQPFVVETPKTLKIRFGGGAGGKGALVQDDKSATLSCNNDQTVFVPAAFGICSKHSHSMLSDNPHSGFYEAETSRTLDTNGGNPSCSQGGVAVVEGNGARPSHKGDGYSAGGPMYTLNATEKHCVAYCMTTGEYMQVLKEQSPTLMARDYKDPPVTNGAEPEYIVRRLTPTECARLQGFPDWWCDDLGNENPTDEEFAFWRDVFETHRLAVTHAKRPKTDRQIQKWLKEPHSDSAEYRMWGNGVALPNVHFVLSAIVDYARNEAT